MEIHERPAISIIIATFNAGAVLAECLQSIGHQTFRSIEIVIADGGSTDDTSEIVRNFNLLPVIFHSEPDKGIYDAMNRGIRYATGKWFYFMGSDDLLLSGFSELAVKLTDESTVYYGDSEAFHRHAGPVDFELLIGEFSSYRLAKHCMNHQVIFYPAAVFSKYQYDLRYKVFADYALNLRVWGDITFRKQYVPVTIAQYNVTGFSSQHADPVFEKEKPGIIKESMGTAMYLRYRFKRLKKKLLGN